MNFAGVSNCARMPGEANVLLCYVIGRWQLFAKTRFKRPPGEQWEAQKRLLLG